MQRYRRNDSKCVHPASNFTYYLRHRNCNYEFKNASICFGNIKIDKCLRRKIPNSGQLHEDGSDLQHHARLENNVYRIIYCKAKKITTD